MAALWIVVLVYTVLAVFLAIGLRRWDYNRAEKESELYRKLADTKLDSESLSSETHWRAVLPLAFPLDKYAEDADVREKLEDVLLRVSAQIEKSDEENQNNKPSPKA